MPGIDSPKATPTDTSEKVQKTPDNSADKPRIKEPTEPKKKTPTQQLKEKGYTIRETGVTDEIKYKELLEAMQSPQRLEEAATLSQVIFDKKIQDLSPQQIALFAVDYKEPQTIRFMDVLAGKQFEGKLFTDLSTEEKGKVLKSLYEDAENVTNDFLSANLYGKSFKDLNPAEQTEIQKRTDRLAILTETNRVAVKRADISVTPTPNKTGMDDYISAGDRFSIAVVERSDIASFLLFGVPAAETTAQEREFLQHKVVLNLESNLGLLSPEQSQIDTKDLQVLADQLQQIRNTFTDLYNLPARETSAVEAQPDAVILQDELLTLPVEEHIAKLEQELGIETDGQRLLEATLLIDGKFIRTAAITGVEHPERMFGDNEWADWLAARQYAQDYGDQDITPEFLVAIHKKLTQRTNAEIGGRIRSVAVVGGDYKTLGDPVVYSQEEYQALQDNPLLSFIPRGKEPTSGLIGYPAIVRSWDKKSNLDLSQFTPEQQIKIAASTTTQELITTLLGDTCEWYNQARQNPNTDPYALAAELQRRLVSIHPFEDMNGRTSRLVMQQVLENQGVSPSALYDPSMDILTSQEAWTEYVKEWSEGYDSLINDRERMDNMGYHNAAEILGLSDEEAFYRYIFRHTQEAPTTAKGQTMEHAPYETFLDDLDEGKRLFNDTFTAKRTVGVEDKDTETEINQGGLIPKYMIDLIDPRYPQNEANEYLDRLFNQEMSIFRGGLTPETLTVDDALRMFDNFTAIESGYQALNNAHLSPTSARNMSPSAVQRAYEQYNQMLAYSYLLWISPDSSAAETAFPAIKPFTFEETVQSHIGARKDTVPSIFDSPFVSTSTNRIESERWASRKFQPNAASGVFIEASCPNTNVVLTFGSESDIRSSDITYLQKRFIHPQENEVLVPGAIHPASIKTVTLYTFNSDNNNRGSESLKATRIFHNGQEYIKVLQREEGKEDPAITWYTKNEEGKFGLTEEPSEEIDNIEE